jgi:hypothetical protein
MYVIALKETKKMTKYWNSFVLSIDEPISETRNMVNQVPMLVPNYMYSLYSGNERFEELSAHYIQVLKREQSS